MPSIITPSRDPEVRADFQNWLVRLLEDERSLYLVPVHKRARVTQVVVLATSANGEVRDVTQWVAHVIQEPVWLAPTGVWALQVDTSEAGYATAFSRALAAAGFPGIRVNG